MKYLYQFTLILTISFIGELLNKIIPFPVPASIYGLVIMFFCLQFKIFPLNAVKETSNFLISIMSVMFVPPSVSVILAVPVLKEYWWQFSIIAVVSTCLVMGVTGWTTQGIIKLQNKSKKEKENKK